MPRWRTAYRELDTGVELVYFGENEPIDRSKRWQKTDAYGAYIGAIKTFNGSIWE